MGTIRDVAKRAGVSTATVSRYMNQPDIVSEKAQARICRAIEELRFQPNPMARALQTQKSRIIGLVVPTVDYAFFSRLTDAVERACHRNGYKLMLCQSAGSDAREPEMVQLLRANKVDGILLCSRLGDASLYTQNDVPIVSIDRVIDGIPSVTADNYSGGTLAARALFDAGCRRPLLLTTEVPPYMEMFQRQRGFLESCESLHMRANVYVMREIGFSNVQAGEIKALFCGDDAPDGVFAVGDMTAAGFIHMALLDDSLQKRRLPIVGFDGLDISELFECSTIAQPIREMGEYAVEILIQRIKGLTAPERTKFPVRYIARKSTLKYIKEDAGEDR